MGLNRYRTGEGSAFRDGTLRQMLRHDSSFTDGTAPEIGRLARVIRAPRSRSTVIASHRGQPDPGLGAKWYDKLLSLPGTLVYW